MINWIKDKYRSWYYKSKNQSSHPNALEFTAMLAIWLLILFIIPIMLFFILDMIGLSGMGVLGEVLGVLGIIILFFQITHLCYKANE